MQRSNGDMIYSATDLNNFLECHRLTELDTRVALHHLLRPETEDAQAGLIKRKGDQHERAYLARLQSEHPDDVVVFDGARSGSDAYHEAEARTLSAMRSGAKIIYQATFFDGLFLGHADFLRRVERPSALGGWSYEILDTKLALSSKPYFIIQLCNYAEHIGRLQGHVPDSGYIILGDNEEQRFHLPAFMAYYRHLKARFLEFVASENLDPAVDAREYPLKCHHCVVCPWNDACSAKRKGDDHLSLVAGMRRDQTRKLESGGIATVAVLGKAADADRPLGMNPASFAKLRKQASLQVRGRSEGPRYEVLAHEAPVGFGLLPAPDDGDVYFDMEGDPLYEPGRGLEYLFGCWVPSDSQPFVAFWGLDRDAEKTAFEAFVDFVTERRKRYPSMHIYHYANYEKAALRRLSQEHGTREDEVDELLRGEVLVDLYAVVRQALMISEDSYSIKRLEKFYGLKRATGVKKGDDSIVMFETWLQQREQRILDDIEAYNRDDCESTLLLHRWLLERRLEATSTFGHEFPFRPVKDAKEPCHAPYLEGCKQCAKRRSDEREEQRRSELEHRLLLGAAKPRDEREFRNLVEDARARYLMAHLLAYHRREEKSVWWAYHDRCDNTDQLQEFDHEAIGGLELTDAAPYKLGARDRNLVFTYRYPEQRQKMERGTVHNPHTKESAGELVDIDDDLRIVKLKRPGDAVAAAAVTALIPGGPIRTDAQQHALTRIAEHFVNGTLKAAHPATYDLLVAGAPRTTLYDGTLQPDAVNAASVSAVVQRLDASYLFIQGPPGTGKSTVGSHVICDLLQAGKRVGVLSTGHKAIHHLLHMVEAVMAKRGGSFRGLYKHTSGNEGSRFGSRLDVAFIESVDDNASFSSREYDLAAGTSWLFSRDELVETFDYLFIDEAGQVSLADAIAVSACSKNLVLLGDPSQLPQVSIGSHALHASDSVLMHILGESITIPADRGIFLDVSYRMHPDVCRFISEVVYDKRLASAPEAARHRIASAGLSGAGLRYAPIEHTGNGPSSEEEAAFIVREIEMLREGTVVDSDGIERAVTDADIIVVTPYNAQRRLITADLRKAGSGVEVGTVNKFQGQQAAVVFYSMATSSGDDAPRDLDFLFERNRFNVAVSRARAMSVLVCSPRLLDVPCRTAAQMELVSVLCTYAEEAQPYTMR